MTEKQESQAVFSKFNVSSDGQRVPVCSGSAVLWVGDSKFDVDCEYYLTLLPEPRVRVKVVADTGFIISLSGSDLRLSFEGGPQMELLLISQHMDFDSEKGSLIFTLKREPSLITLADLSANRATFHLFDFVEFYRSGCLSRSDMGGLSGMRLKGQNYEITLNSLDNTQDNIKATKEDGIVRLTHMGVFRKNDGSNFVFDEYMSFQVELSSFLTFLKGGRNWPCLITGYSGDTLAFRALSAPVASKNSQSWFDPHSASDAENLYPLFSALWAKSDEWQSCLSSVLYWYAQSNTKGGVPAIDACIILAQTALEKLAYQYLVVDRNMISPDGFEKLIASDKIRMLGSCLGIPLGIQPVTTNIFRESSVVRWCDIPHALTYIRNSLVHPKKKHQESIRKCYFEAWNVSVWLLELCILAVSGYTGQYRNRLELPYCPKVSVPWTKEIRGSSADE